MTMISIGDERPYDGHDRPRLLCPVGGPGGVDPSYVDIIARAVPDVDIERVDPVAALLDRSADGILAYPSSPCLRQLSDSIRWVHLLSTGVESLPDSVYAGRTVTCSRGASAGPISEFVLATILAFEKDLPDVWVSEPPARWHYAELGTLRGRQLAVYGFGSIGQAVARLGLAFGMAVRGIRRSGVPSPIPDVEMVDDLRDLVAGAHHVVLSAPATPATYHSFGAETFAAMAAGAHLVNVARGSLVDHEALRSALDSGRIARASLDTTEPEPLPEGHWLYEHPAVRLSPHVSWNSPAGQGSTLDRCIDNIRAFRAGRPLSGVVDPEERY